MKKPNLRIGRLRLVVGPVANLNPNLKQRLLKTKPQPLEIGDSKYIDISKQGLKNLREGNIDGFYC
jgi:hypothetical protein